MCGNWKRVWQNIMTMKWCDCVNHVLQEEPMWEPDNCVDVEINNLIINVNGDSFTSESECNVHNIQPLSDNKST